MSETECGGNLRRGRTRDRKRDGRSLMRRSWRPVRVPRVAAQSWKEEEFLRSSSQVAASDEGGIAAVVNTEVLEKKGRRGGSGGGANKRAAQGVRAGASGARLCSQ